MNYYKGNIIPNQFTIFVFGSNPEGRHGAGAAKTAHDLFGAEYGVGEGLTGNSYAIPTKDLRAKDNNGYRSISEDRIIESIKKMYDCAKSNHELMFMIAYRNTYQRSLNGYTGIEMINMFLKAGEIPDNVWVSEEWYNTGMFNKYF